MQTVGLVGTGLMGEPMARNLMRAGFSLTVCSRTKEKALRLLAEGAAWANTPAQCANGRDAVITMVGSPEEVEQVYFSQDGVFAGAKEGAYLIDMGTTPPSLSVRIDEKARERGMHALDAPVSGGDVGAKNGVLSIMAGGDREAFDACLPLFDALGKAAWQGGAGAGQHTKMANQIVGAANLAGVCEAVAYAAKNGLDLERMLGAVSRGSAGSWQLEHNGPKIIRGDEAPGFFIRHFVKDLNILLEQAKSSGVELEITEAVARRYRKLAQEGFGDLGMQALYRSYAGE